MIESFIQQYKTMTSNCKVLDKPIVHDHAFFFLNEMY